MRILAVALALLLPIVPCRAEWKPAPGSLMTRWAKYVSPEKVHPEYPRPQMVRHDWLNLNGLWQLSFAREGEAAPVGKELPRQILVPFAVETALSGVMEHADRLWYRRTFTVPQAWHGQHVVLHFGAVDWEAKVWVNGRELGVHRGGYDNFSWDITEALKATGDQEVVVGVWDPTDAGPQPRGKQVAHPGGIFYTPTTGIWQTVWLEPVPAAAIDALQIVPDVDRSEARFAIRFHGASGPAKAVVEVSADGKQTAMVRAELRVNPAGELEVTIPIPRDKLRLWSPEQPFLYDATISVSSGGKLDTVTTYFGMRKIALGKDEHGTPRIQLNGKTIFQVGPLDQGFWPDGIYTAPTDEALKADIETIRQLGFNMARKHVKVEPDRWYYWCDRLGLLVWQDMPAGDQTTSGPKGVNARPTDSASQFERELKAMINGLRNHPSVIMWVLFNEGWGQHETERLTDWVKKYDATRLVNSASGWTDRKVGDLHDVHSYPGPAAPAIESVRAGVLGEFGGLGLAVDGHTWSKKSWGYRGAASQEDLTRRYEHLLAKVWKLKEEKGLCAAVYTQITDVETECNGLLTYDRAVIKVDRQRVAAVNRGDLSDMHLERIITVVPTSEAQGQVWHYTLQKPPDDWLKAEFLERSWKQEPGGFGTQGTPGAFVRTQWKTNDIWLRRKFTLPENRPTDLYLLVHHDDDAEIYLNGILAASLPGYTTEYEDVPISAAARTALKPGENVMAVHCHQNTGGQYIDVGLVGTKADRH